MPSRPRWRQHLPHVSTVLAFDCSVTGQGVAVVRDGTVLACLREEGRDQAARLLPAIGLALREARVTRRAVELVAVSTGPGSFTGVRVGLAAARGLAIGLGVPLAGISTTAILRAQAPATERLIVAAVDTRLGDWFCSVGDDAVPSAATAEEMAADLRGRACLVIGHGVVPLVARLREGGIDAIACDGPPDATTLAHLAAADGVAFWQSRNRTEGLPRPLYLRGVNITTPDGTRRTVE
jgi:tRNA threonylcarbamoyladenosine biosynthesis protein TsaB